MEAMTQPHVVFLHAFPLHAAMWDAQLEAVRAAGFEAVALDFPGFGTTHSSGQRTMQEFAQFIVDRLERRDIRDFVLVGLSMGGYAAFRLLEKLPGAVHALVLADTKASPDAPEARTNRLKMAARVEAEGTGFMLDEVIPNLLAPSTSQAASARARELASHATGSAVYNALAALASRPDSRMQLEDIGIPTLVIVGSEDTVTPLEDAQIMASTIPNAKLEIIPGAGHLSNLEQPELFNRVLLEFLEPFRNARV
jgi:3-oxoadipate enol-lactonase